MKTRKLPRVSMVFLSVLSLLSVQLFTPAVYATSYYWDNNGATVNFNLVNGATLTYGTWTTTSGSTYGWSTSSTGNVAVSNVTTTTSDDLNFGFSTTGLTAGTITVSGTQSANSLTFAAGSSALTGLVTLSGGTINLSATGTITVNNVTDSISSVISGAGTSLTKAGTGKLTLSGVNTYTGQTLVNAGTLLTTTVASLPGYNSPGQVVFNGGTVAAQVGGSGWSTAQVDTLLTNATKTSGSLGIDTTNGDLTQWTAFTTTNLGPALGLTKSGYNTLTLNQVNSYTGPTTISGGTLNITDTGTGLTQTLGGSLILSGFSDVTLQSNNAGSGTLSTTFGTLSRSVGNTTNILSVGGTNGTTNLINLTGAAGFIDKGVYFGGSSFAALNATNGYVTSMVYDGTNNTATSNTIAASNHVQLTSSPASRVGDSLLSLNLSGSGVNYTMSSGTLTVPAILKSGGGSVSTISGGTAVTGGTGIELVIRTDTSSDLLTISTPVTGTGALTKSGDGKLTLSGASTYTGNTYINGGTLEISGTLSAGNYVQSIYINKGATFLYDGSASQGLNGASLSGDGNVTISATGSGGVVFGAKPSNPEVYTGTTTLNSGFLRTYGTNIGPGNLTINGGYMDDYFGNGGNFIRPLGSGAGQVQILGGTSGWSENGNTTGAVVINNSAATEVQWGSSFFNPTTLILQASTAQSGSSLTFQNKLDLNGAVRTISTSGGTTGAASATLSGVVRNSSGTASGLTVIGGGTLKLTAANTYNGVTKLSAGILSLGNSLALQNSVFDATNSVTGSTANGLKTTVTTLTLGGLNGTKDLSTLFTTSSGGFSSVTALTLNPASTDTAVYSGIIANGAANMTLTKTGLGTQTLSGASTYSGVTNINAGTLMVNNTSGSGTGTGAVNVNNNGTLSGTGTISGAVSVSTGGSLTPGNSGIGTLSSNNGLTAASGITLNFDLSNNPSGSNDLLAVTGNLSLATATLNINATGGDVGLGTYKLITYTGSLTGDTTGWTIGNNNASGSYLYSFSTATANEVDLIVAATSSPTGSGTWKNGSTDGKWTTNTGANNNWATGIPLVMDNVATFDDTVTGMPGTVDLNGSQTVGAVAINTTTHGYTLGLANTANTLTLQVSSGTASITTTGGGSHTINAKVVTASNATISVAGTSSLNLVQGIDNSNNKNIALTQAGSGTLSAGNINNGTTGTVTVTGTVAADTISGSGTTTVTNNSWLTVNNITGSTPVTGGAVSIQGTNANASALLTMNATPTAAPTDAGSGGASGTMVLSSLSISNAINPTNGHLLPTTASPFTPSSALAASFQTYYGTLDLQNNNLVVAMGQYSQIQDMARSASDLTLGGVWDGKGLTSSWANQVAPGGGLANTYNGSTAIGVIINNGDQTEDPAITPFEQPLYAATGASLGTTFEGYTGLTGNETLVKYTWVGDANLDGKVDLADYNLFAAGVSGATASDGLPGWFFGDFNYDGVVDLADYNLLAAGISASNNGTISLPEPSTFVLAAFGLLGLLAARRRKANG